MNATLWVIWISAVILSGSIGLAVGGWYCPNENLLRERYWDGRRDEARACPGHGDDCEAADDEPWPSDPDGWEESAWRAEERAGEPRWDDTAEHLAAAARPYYEPLARGGGEDSETPKGDSPGPMPSPIFDELAAERAALDLRPPLLLAGLAGDGAKPPGPRCEAPAEVGTGDGSNPSGPGADVWDRIAADLDEDPQLNEWAIRAEVDRCTQIRRELQQLGKTFLEAR